MFLHRVQFRLSQDPNSENLGTTVWDASIVLAKYLEKVCLPTELLAPESLQALMCDKIQCC